jgi:hypothetical protein
MLFEIFGILFAAIVQGIVITIYGSKSSCENLPNATSISSTQFNNETIVDSTKYSKLVKKIKMNFSS